MISGNPVSGLKIGLIEIITKMTLYYLHERAWVSFEMRNSQKRHLLKTMTWRFIGTMDTVAIAWIITGSPLTGLNIGSVELVTKLILYYIHERVWYRTDYGLDTKIKPGT